MKPFSATTVIDHLKKNRLISNQTSGRTVLIAGGSGFIGRALVETLSLLGYDVLILSRNSSHRSPYGRTFFWNPEQGIVVVPDDLKIDTAINLSGLGIAERRWGDEYKTNLISSRVISTRTLTEFLANRRDPPALFMSASGVGLYRPSDRPVGESGSTDESFLAKMAFLWEQAANQYIHRAIILRLGVVLSVDGGALKKMLPAFRFGLGGRLGTGEQFLSWISLEDVVASIIYLMEDHTAWGPFNITAPQIVTNSEFTKTLATALNRPAFFHLPAVLLKLLLGQMAQELLLKSVAAVPEKLTVLGFKFVHPQLKDALKL